MQVVGFARNPADRMEGAARCELGRREVAGHVSPRYTHPVQPLRIIAILLGGAAGALSRFGLSRLISGQLVHSIFPWATLAINAAGSFAIGFFFEFFGRFLISVSLRDFVVVGFLGAFTTFSTYTLETLNLIRDNEWGWGLLNIIASNLLGIAMVIFGVLLGRWVVRS